MKRAASLIAFGACLIFLLLLAVRLYGIAHRTVDVLPDTRTDAQIAIQPLVDTVEVAGAVGFGILGFVLYDSSKPEDAEEVVVNKSGLLKLS